MSVVADYAGRTVRRSRGLMVALAISVTLNIFIVGGIAWSIMRAEPVEGPVAHLLTAARSLDLRPDQRAGLREFAQTARQLNRKLRESNGPIMRQMWNELSQPQPDQAKITQLSEQALQNRVEYQRKMEEGIMTFLSTLAPDQRSRFVEIASQHPAPLAPGQRIFRFVVP